MKIFVDESGNFMPLRPEGAPLYEHRQKYSAVAALIIPHSTYSDVIRETEQVARELGLGDGEWKGRDIKKEDQFCKLIQPLHRHDVILCVACIDLGQHSERDIEAHQKEAARLMYVGTENCQPMLKSEVRAFADQLESLKPQLYVDALLKVQVLHLAGVTSMLRYAQTRPEELGAFQWRIDAKDKNITAQEELWNELKLPWLEEMSRRDPAMMIAGYDYSRFAPFEFAEGESPQSLPSPQTTERRTAKTNLRKLYADTEFVNSQSDRGIQLADIAASAFARGCNGNLKRRGWWNLGGLLIERPRQYFKTVRNMVLFEEDRILPHPKSIRFLKEMEVQARSFMLEVGSPRERWRMHQRNAGGRRRRK